MRTIRISAKCSDLFCANMSEDGKPVGQDYEGYVPDWFPNPKEEHYGDYVSLDIDLDTGKILNWRKPSLAALKKTFQPKVAKCAVPECENESIFDASISINGKPGKLLPVCRCHFDAAMEDLR